MKFLETSKYYYLNKFTYVNLRWIAYTGQLLTVLLVQFILEYKFDYIYCLLIIFFGFTTNLYLQFRIRNNQLNTILSSIFLAYDILQLGILFFLTGGITNPFIFLIIIPSVFSSQHLDVSSSILLVFFTVLNLIFLTFYYHELPSPNELHFHTPDYYLYGITISIFIGLLFLVYFGVKFKIESTTRMKAYDKIQEIMSKENELLSLGGQAAAAAHSLGTPLSTILLTVKELQKDFSGDLKLKKDLDLLASQSNRCSEILKKLTLNPNVEDQFIDANLSLDDYIREIVRSFQEISKKNFIINLSKFTNRINTYKSSEIIYGLRNFIGNANKFSNDEVEIFLRSDKRETEIIIKDDGPGFPKDLINKHKLGEPYIRTTDNAYNSKYGLGLGTFIGKTLLEKNFAYIEFRNDKKNGGAEVIIRWNNKDLIKF